MGASKIYIKQWTRNLITSGLEEHFSVQIVRKIMMINIISLIAIATLVPLGILAFAQGNPTVGFLDNTLATILIANLLYLRRSGRYDLVSYVGISFAGALFMYLFVTGGPNNTGYLWYYTFPLFASFLLGSKRGAIATLILLLFAVVFFSSSITQDGFATYTTDFIIRFIASFVLVFGYAYLFEKLRERTQEKLSRKNDELEVSLVELTETEAALRRARDELEERVKERTAELTVANERLKQEIGEREVVAQALRDSEKRLRAILDSILTGVVVVDADTHVIADVNPMGRELIGASKEEIVGRECHKFILLGEKGKSPVSELGQTVVRSESTLTNSQGKEVPILKTVVPVVLNERRRLIGSFVDITEQKRAEEALMVSKEQVRKMNEALSQGLSEVFDALSQISSGDPSVRITETSKLESIAKLKQMVNSTAENLGEIVGLSHEFAMGLAEHFDTLHRVSKGDRSARVLGHSQVELLELLKSVTNDMIESVSKEISERKQAEEAFRKAKDEAELANVAKSQFLANMSHEIRTPLNAVIGMTEVTLGTGLTEEQREYLETVRVSSESLLNLLNDILDFSKIEACQLELDEIDFDPRTTLENVMDMLAVYAEEGGIELIIDIKPGVPTTLVGDPTRLRQIIVNLAGNAIRFTEEGHVAISVETEKEEDSGVFLHFVVSDTGIGISPDKADSVFESFKQADGSTTRKYGGTGLGLAISKQLVEMMGGKIWVDSELGKGSTFHFMICFKLGRSVMALEHPINDTPRLMKHHTIQEAQRKLSVLLVEDNPVNRKVAKTMLDKRGHRVVVAANGREALDALDRERVDIVLMDVQMPEMDGFEATERIRKREKINSGHVPIIAMTAHAMKGDRERCLAAGMDSYISKPIREADLFSITENLANGSDDEKKNVLAPSETVMPVVDGVFDLPKAMSVVDGDKALFEEIANLFLNVAADNIARLREGVAKGDPTAVEEATHALKGSAGHFGAKRTLEAVHRLELIGKNGTWAEAETAQLELEREFKALETVMKRALAA